MSNRNLEQALNARARRAATRVGLMARKSRRGKSLDNFGGFSLIEPDGNYVIAGSSYELSAEDIIGYCKPDDKGSN